MKGDNLSKTLNKRQIFLVSVQSLSLTLCDPTDCSMPGLPVYHQLLEFAQTHVQRIGDAIPLSHPLSSLLLLPSIFPSIRVLSNESVLRIRWPKYWVSASASVLPINIQDWFPLGGTGWISLLSKGLSRVFSNTTFQKYQFWVPKNWWFWFLVHKTWKWSAYRVGCYILLAYILAYSMWASQVAIVVKNPLANAGDIRDTVLIPRSGRSPEGRHDNSLQYSGLENPMDRGAWRAIVHGVADSQARLKWLSTHAQSTYRTTTN